METNCDSKSVEKLRAKSVKLSPKAEIKLCLAFKLLSVLLADRLEKRKYTNGENIGDKSALVVVVVVIQTRKLEEAEVSVK